MFFILIFSTSKVLHAFSNDTIKQAEPVVESTAEPVENTHAAKHEKFNAGELIVGHISDAYDWHIAGDHEHPFSIPLPVILYTDKGFDVFLSSAFHHGKETVKGKYNYKLGEKNHIFIVNEDGTVNEEATGKIWDISITKNVVSMFFTLALMLWIWD